MSTFFRFVWHGSVMVSMPTLQSGGIIHLGIV